MTMIPSESALKLGMGASQAAIHTTSNNTCLSRVFTVYLVRHGEAIHNVAEKRAKQDAMRICAERGLSPDQEETRRHMEEARKRVLDDDTFFDATITEHGRKEAKQARARLDQFAKEGLPEPRQVFSSPLQRCLGTVEELFPDENVGVRVEEHLRERLTGRPADNRYGAEFLEERFPRFDFTRLRSLSQSNLMEDCADSATETDISDASSSCGLSDDLSDVPTTKLSNSDFSRLGVSFRKQRVSSLNTDVEVEDDAAVRKRAFHLLGMLKQSEENSVAVVTHKGFLRALERGCFGLEESAEFKNCEVRVYRIEMNPENLFLEKVERLR